MPEAIQTNVVVCEGGLNNQANPITIRPGESLISMNYEPSLLGGYRRITGHSKWDTNVVPGAGDRVLGCAVFNGGVIAARDDANPFVDIYFSTGSGWGTQINSDTTRTAGGKHYFTKYNYTGTNRIIGVDGKNLPFRYESDGTYTLINASGSPANAKVVAEFKNHIFYGGYTSNAGAITFSVPLDEEDFTALSGAGEIVIGDKVVQLTRFRDALIIFCQSSIYRLIGDSKFNFEIEPITKKIGCNAPDSVQELGGDLYFLGPDGIRTLAATERLGDVELATVSKKIQDLIPNIHAVPLENITSIAIKAKSQYRLHYATNSGTIPDSRGIIGGLVNDSEGNLIWEWMESKGMKPFCMDSDFVADEELFIFGDFNGFIQNLENGNDFAGTAVPSVLQTAYNHFDDPTRRKTCYKATVFYQAEGLISLDVYLMWDYDDPNKLQPPLFTIPIGGSIDKYGSGLYGTATYGSSDIPRAKHTTIGSGYQLSLRFIAEDSNPPHIIQGFALEYGLGGRR